MYFKCDYDAYLQFEPTKFSLDEGSTTLKMNCEDVVMNDDIFVDKDSLNAAPYEVYHKKRDQYAEICIDCFRQFYHFMPHTANVKKSFLFENPQVTYKDDERFIYSFFIGDTKITWAEDSADIILSDLTDTGMKMTLECDQGIIKADLEIRDYYKNGSCYEDAYDAKQKYASCYFDLKNLQLLPKLKLNSSWTRKESV